MGGFIAGWLLGFACAVTVAAVTGLQGDARTLSVIMASTFVGSFVAAGVQWHQNRR